MNFSTEQDAFLKLAVEGPIVFAGQFSAINKLGALRMIVIPINQKDGLIIFTPKEDMIYYFTVELEQCDFSFASRLIMEPDFPEIFITSTEVRQIVPIPFKFQIFVRSSRKRHGIGKSGEKINRIGKETFR